MTGMIYESSKYEYLIYLVTNMHELYPTLVHPGKMGNRGNIVDFRWEDFKRGFGGRIHDTPCHASERRGTIK